MRATANCFEAGDACGSPLAGASLVQARGGAAGEGEAAARAGARPVRILTFSSLFPSAARPRHGIFVETRLLHLLKDTTVQARVIAPVPWFPFRGRLFGQYAQFAATPRRETRGGGLLEVRYPRYLMAPKVGVALQPDSMARASWPGVARLCDAGWVPDLIDAHYFYPDGVAAALLARRLRRPYVITARGTDINVLAKMPGPARRILWAAQGAAAVIAVSSRLKDALVALGVDAAKIQVLRNGIDLDRFTPEPRDMARQRLGLPEGRLAACVGNLVPEKGQALAVEALCHLPDCRLVIVGDGPARKELIALGHSLGVAERLIFRAVMPQDELRFFYSAIDVLLLTSTREGWPNVVLESMACGTPVVATDVGAVGDMLTRPHVGRIVPGRDAPAFAAAVAGLLGAPVSRESIRSHAAQYDWQAVSKAQSMLFAELLELAAMAKPSPGEGPPVHRGAASW